MSPPLESQMCFTPIPLSIAKMPLDQAQAEGAGGAGGLGGTGLPSLGQVVDAAGDEGGGGGGGIIAAPTPARLGSKSQSKSRSRSHSTGTGDGHHHPPLTQTKIPMPMPMTSKRHRFPVTIDAGAGASAHGPEYVEVGDFAPFRTPSPQKKLKKKTKSGSTEGGTPSAATPVREREHEFFWTPKLLRKKEKEKEGYPMD
ncbi:hypothetical protein CPB84DRAFT_1778433 [Gymnopilus junonius]|uniref:Uncharacterized protein n=1 Tax=Gymnopilus junonius TaxID=109634 RepID=A0A9P5NKZ1_GYMJU|nr:hypothetical protein CPB84DRAFT_1778433 [Gymnopilus junonius]